MIRSKVYLKDRCLLGCSVVYSGRRLPTWTPSETSINFYQITQLYNPEDRRLRRRRKLILLRFCWCVLPAKYWCSFRDIKFLYMFGHLRWVSFHNFKKFDSLLKHHQSLYITLIKTYIKHVELLCRKLSVCKISFNSTMKQGTSRYSAYSALLCQLIYVETIPGGL